MFRAALKANIDQIMRGEEEVGETTLIRIGGKLVTRINLIATIVSKESDGQAVLLDDGTGTIRLRSFGSEQKPLGSFTVGETVQIIGRVRSYSGEKYVSAEIVRKTTPIHKKLRELEIAAAQSQEPLSRPTEEKTIDEDALPEEDFSGAMKIRELIKELDDGKGADMMEVTSRTDVPNPDNVIKNLLEMGEIFEVRPGRLKVLE